MAMMTPANICSGFQKCGIYPFNPDAIDCTISTNDPAGHVQRGAGNETDEDEEERAAIHQQMTMRLLLIYAPARSPSLL